MPTYSQAQVNGYGSFVTQNNFIPFAVTKHYDTQHPTDPIETINFIDGLGKNIQVKKDIEVNTGSPQEPNYEQKMSVSGYVTNDVWGRAIKSYQPRSENKNNTINFLINQAATPISSFNRTVQMEIFINMIYFIIVLFDFHFPTTILTISFYLLILNLN